MDKIITMQKNWTLEEKYKQSYVDSCLLAATDENEFQKFRQHPVISTIIENSTKAWMTKAYNYLRQHKPWMIKKLSLFAKSDVVGGAVVYPVKSGVNEVNVSPTTMRYVLIAHYLTRFVGLWPGMKIVEIGGGYGGLCKIIHDLVGFKEYVMYDLPEVQQLQDRFLRHFGIKVTYAAGMEELKSADLVISWCAWSELDFETRKEYVEKVISKSKKVFICANYNVNEDLALLQPSGEIETYGDELCHNILYR